MVAGGCGLFYPKQSAHGPGHTAFLNILWSCYTVSFKWLQVAVDCFILNNQHMDLATISSISKYLVILLHSLFKWLQVAEDCFILNNQHMDLATISGISKYLVILLHSLFNWLQVAVDCFILNNQHMDLATISGISKFRQGYQTLLKNHEDRNLIILLF